MTVRILGLDICRDRAVCWLLEEFPRNPKQYWKDELKSRSKDPTKDGLTFYFTKPGLDALIAIKPDYIALEPTGMHYSTLVVKACEKHGIKVLWVGHVQSKNHRASLKLPDKNDLADSFALAHYAKTYLEQPVYFIQFEPGKIARLKQTFLESKSLCRYQGPLLNRIRQQLSHEFPEAAAVVIKPNDDGRRALICWLAGRDRIGIRKSRYWDNRYENSVAHEYGIELSPYTRHLASHIDDYDVWQLEISKEMRELVYDREFLGYNLVFDEFGFHLGLRALLLSLIYPFSRFPGMPEFKKRIGSAQREESSGNTASWKTGDGSSLCRSEFYLWVSNKLVGLESREIPEKPEEPILKVLKFYKDWKLKFYADKDKWVKHYQLKSLETYISKLESILQADLVSTLSPTKQKSFNAILEKSKLAMFDDVELNKLVPSSQSSKKFGILIINKTIGYTSRLLYRRLRDTLK